MKNRFCVGNKKLNIQRNSFKMKKINDGKFCAGLRERKLCRICKMFFENFSQNLLIFKVTDKRKIERHVAFYFLIFFINIWPIFVKL